MNLKRFSIITLALIMTFTSFAGILPATVAQQSESTLGDINGNDEIDSMDYVLLKRAYFGTYKLEDMAVGDINGNGEIDSMDYVYLRRAYFGTYVIQTPDHVPSPDDSQPESSVPESSVPESSAPESSEPESSSPESSEPESSEPESSAPEAVKPVTLTQTSVVTNENFTTLPAFSEFLATAEKSVLIPGLTEPIVPQGLARNPETGYIYVTAYYSDSSKASVILVMNPSGTFVAEYFVYNADGSNYTGHMGGIAVTEKYLYFSGPSVNGNYTVAEFALSDLPLSGSHNITINKTVALAICASYLFYDDGMLWAGNFYLEGSYDLGRLFNFKTANADGTQYGGYAAAFEVDESRLVVDSEAGYAVPSHVLATPDKVQGFAYKNGKVALSISYGRNNNSTLGFYNIDLNNHKKTIAVDGLTYGLTILDSTNRVKNVTTMCMTEGVTLSKDGKLLILYESAAKKYYNSKNPTDYIWEYAFPN